MANKRKKWLDKNLKERQGHFDKKKRIPFKQFFFWLCKNKGFMTKYSINSQKRGHRKNIALFPLNQILKSDLMVNLPISATKSRNSWVPYGEKTSLACPFVLELVDMKSIFKSWFQGDAKSSRSKIPNLKQFFTEHWTQEVARKVLRFSKLY